MNQITPLLSFATGLAFSLPVPSYPLLTNPVKSRFTLKPTPAHSHNRNPLPGPENDPPSYSLSRIPANGANRCRQSTVQDTSQSLRIVPMSGAAQQQQQPGSASGGDGPNRNATRPTNRRPIDDFVDFVEDTKKKCVGRNGLKEREPYIPLDALEEYWHPTSIRALCRSLHLSIPCEVHAIKSRFLRTFSLLVHVDMVSHLDVFVKWTISDAHFPLAEDSLPSVLKQPLYKGLVRAILMYQWLFFPLVLKPAELSGIHLPDRLILPFDSEETIYQSNSSNITKTVTRSSSSPEIQVSLKPYFIAYSFLPRFPPVG